MMPVTTGPPRGLRLALIASTARWRPPRALPGDARAAVQRAMQAGWRFRQVSPRWDTVWRPLSGDLARHRMVVGPAPGFGMRGADLTALWRDRLAAAGLPCTPPEPAALRSARQAWAAALAPPWLTEGPSQGAGDGGLR